MSFRIALLFLPLFIASAHHAYAEEDVMLRDSNRCNRYFSQVETEHQIPANLLKAVSITESGVYHKESQKMIPWPWAVNSQGKGYFFKSKVEAMAAVRKMILNGVTSIDVGCMQINLRYHPEAFKNLEQAFEPRTNIAYAAKFLQGNFTRLRSWRNAVASYHSETPQFGRPYAKKVLDIWMKQANGSSSYASIPEESTSYQLASSDTKLSPMLMSPRNTPARRKSNMFIKVRQRQSPDMARMNVVENITQNVLHKYPGKSTHPLTVLD